MFLIAYTDGQDALDIRKEILENNRRKVLEKYLYELCQETIIIKEIQVAFWEVGTHFYNPGAMIDFEKLRNPVSGVFVIGESVSYSQGWCGGALESVEDIF